MIRLSDLVLSVTEPVEGRCCYPGGMQLICAPTSFDANIAADALANDSETRRSMRSRICLFWNLDGAEELAKH